MKCFFDTQTACFRPVWVDPQGDLVVRQLGALLYYLSIEDESPAEVQMTVGYENSSGFSPSPWDHTKFSLTFAGLHSDEHDEDYAEIARCPFADSHGSTVIFYQYAVTAVVRGNEIVWLARLD